MFNQSVYTENAEDLATTTLVLNQPSPVQFEVSTGIIDVATLGTDPSRVWYLQVFYHYNRASDA